MSLSEKVVRHARNIDPNYSKRIPENQIKATDKFSSTKPRQKILQLSFGSLQEWPLVNLFTRISYN